MNIFPQTTMVRSLLSLLLLACIVSAYPLPALAVTASPSLLVPLDAIPDEPGVYPSSDGKHLIVVALGKITDQLQRARAERLAVMLAERDARMRLARYLFPKETRDGSFSVTISGAHTLRQQVMPGNQSVMRVVLAVAPESVALLPYSALQEHYDVRLAPVVEKVLLHNPLLAEGGGKVLSQDGGWLVVGVGYAPLPDGADWSQERAARTVARVNAEKEISSAVFGARVMVEETQRTIMADGPGGIVLKEWASTRFSEEINGVFSHVLQAGEWKTLDDRLGVVMIVGRPEPVVAMDIFADQGSPSATSEPSTFTAQEEWRAAVLSRPWLHQGGLALHQNGEEMWLLVADGAALTDNPVHDRVQLPLLAETQARNSAVRYLSGLRLSSTEVETDDHFYDGVTDKEKAAAMVTAISRENTLGVLAGMRKVGEWMSDDGRIRYFVFAVKLS